MKKEFLHSMIQHRKNGFEQVTCGCRLENVNFILPFGKKTLISSFNKFVQTTNDRHQYNVYKSEK